MTATTTARFGGSMLWSNWSGSQHCRPKQLLVPQSEDELADIVKRAATGIRAVGAGHSFSAIVPTDDMLITLEHLAGLQGCDARAQQITCGGGTTIRDLGEPLYERGLALTNQGDVDAQTIAGACSTGTHGTGVDFGCLATDVIGLRLITAAGEVVDCDAQRNRDLFFAARVSLGTFGIASRVTVQCRSAFSLRERLEVMPLEDCLSRADEFAVGNRHFEFFHFPYADRVLVKTMNQAEDRGRPSIADRREDALFGWACAVTRRFPALNPLLQRTAMRWYPGRQRCDRSYRVFPSARTVRFNEMEYEVPADAGVACFRELVELLRRQRLTDCFPVEFRRVRGDSLWLSPFFERDSVSISVHQHHRQPYNALFRVLEPVFWEYGGRPHWGKLHTLAAPQLQALYPRWREFHDLRQQLDPEGKFLNPYLRQLFGVSN